MEDCLRWISTGCMNGKKQEGEVLNAGHDENMGGVLATELTSCLCLSKPYWLCRMRKLLER